ncbi:MAG TPA: MarR family transcriptional regulator [Acidobacteriaceae bacterium]|jgi:DNA-binding MarR family transcriptional regulator|nr:MarR family transcriptional regulator [Acidobacteriaceae bacterium]
MPDRSSLRFFTATLPRSARLQRDFSDAVVFFHAAVAARLGMSAAEWKCLGILEQHGKMTAGRLAEFSGLTTGAITGIIDRLERAGYARRESNPRDRRSVLVAPGNVRALRDEVKAVFASLVRAMESVSSQFSVEQQRVVEDWLEKATLALRDRTRALRGTRLRAKKDGTNGKLSVPGGQ